MTVVHDSAAQGRGACAVRPANLPRPRPISVNGVTIPRAVIAREVQNHPAAKPVDAWLAAARALVVRELLLQEARRVGIEPEPLADIDGRRETDEEAQIRGLIEREVATPEPDEATCRRYWEQNRRRFRSPDLCAARHILLPAAPGNAPGRAEARRLAETIVEQLKSEPDAFAALARAHSACPSRETGGHLGQLGPGQTVPEFEAALARIEPGCIAAAPVETRYGFHVVALDQRIDGTELPFELVQACIADRLVEQSRRTAIRQYISLLAGRATICGIELAQSPSPLVR